MAQKNEKEKSERINVGRRAFLKTAGVAPLAAGVVGGVAELEAQASRVVGPGEVPITLMVNGKRLTLTLCLVSHVAPPSRSRPLRKSA